MFVTNGAHLLPSFFLKLWSLMQSSVQGHRSPPLLPLSPWVCTMAPRDGKTSLFYLRVSNFYVLHVFTFRLLICYCLCLRWWKEEKRRNTTSWRRRRKGLRGTVAARGEGLMMLEDLVLCTLALPSRVS